MHQTAEPPALATQRPDVPAVVAAFVARLMAKSLHGYTAKLPLIEIKPKLPTNIWGRNTESAIQLGIANAVLGVADQLIWDSNGTGAGGQTVIAVLANVAALSAANFSLWD